MLGTQHRSAFVIGDRDGVEVDGAPGVHEDRARDLARGGNPCVADQRDRRARGVDHVADAIGRRVGCDRHVLSARGEDRVDRNNQLDRPWHAHHDAVLRADPESDEFPCESGHPRGELAGGDRAPVAAQRDGVRRSQVVGDRESRRHREVRQGDGAPDRELLLGCRFGCREDRDVGDVEVRVGGEGVEGRAQRRGDRLRGRLVEQRGGIGDRAGQPAVRRLAEADREVELRVGVLEFDELGVEIVECTEGGVAVDGVDEQDLRERFHVLDPPRVHGVDHALERDVGVVERGEVGVLHLIEQCSDGEVRLDVDRQDDGVDEHADQLVDLRPAATGNRCGHRDPGRRRQAREHRGGGRVGHHEQGGASGRGTPPQVRDDRCRQRPPHRGRPSVGHGGAGPIGRQRQHVGQTGQPFGPEPQLSCHQGFGVRDVTEPVSLPHRVIRVLEPQGGQVRHPTRSSRPVGLGDLRRQHRRRLTVGGDVMQRDHEYVFGRRHGDDASPHRQVGRHVERGCDEVVDLLVDDLVGRCDGPRRDHRVADREPPRPVVQNERHGFDTDGHGVIGPSGVVRRGVRGSGGVCVGSPRRVDGAQHLVPVDDVEDRRAHRGHVEVAAHADHDRDHVGGRLRIELVEEPHPALRVREGHRVRPANGLECRQFAAGTVFPGVDGGGQRADGGRLEQRPHRNLDAECDSQACHDPGRRQRRSAEIEERRLRRHLLWSVESQYLGIDRRDRLLGRSFRPDVYVPAETRRGQCPAVELPGGGQGDLVERHDEGGHHVGGQPTGRVGRHFPGVGCNAGDTVNPGHEDRLSRGRVLDSGGRREIDRLVLAEDGVDLTELDPEAADLDLEVAAAEEVQCPSTVSPAPPDEVPGAVHPLSWRTERRRDEPFGGERRLAEVTGGERSAGQVQLTGHPGRNGMQARIEHRDGDPGNRTADGDRRVRAHRCGRRGPDGGLGGAVEVSHRATGRPAPDQFRRADVPGDGDDLEIRETVSRRHVRARLGEHIGHRRECGRGDGRMGDVFPAQDRREFGAARHPVRHHDHRRRTRHRDQCLEDSRVETRCREAEYTCGRCEVEADARIGDQVGQPPVRDRDAFRPARRPGGEDDVGGLVGSGTTANRVDFGRDVTGHVPDPVHLEVVLDEDPFHWRG